MFKITFQDYQNEAARTAPPGKDELQLSIFALGLVGEAGEVAELVKKQVGHGHDADVSKVRKELGDVLWYLAALATYYDLDLDDIAQGNIDKLRLRYPDGFSSEASKARIDVE